MIQSVFDPGKFARNRSTMPRASQGNLIPNLELSQRSWSQQSIWGHDRRSDAGFNLIPSCRTCWIDACCSKISLERCHFASVSPPCESRLQAFHSTSECSSEQGATTDHVQTLHCLSSVIPVRQTLYCYTTPSLHRHLQFSNSVFDTWMSS